MEGSLCDASDCSSRSCSLEGILFLRIYFLLATFHFTGLEGPGVIDSILNMLRNVELLQPVL